MRPSIQRRIYLSLPMHRRINGVNNDLSQRYLHLVTALAERLDDLGYRVLCFGRPGMFPRPELFESPLTAVPWSYESVDAAMRRCHGVIFLGFPRWVFQTEGEAGPQEWWLASEYSHYEGALAVTLHLPRLILAEGQLANRGVFGEQHGDFILRLYTDASPAWLETPEFQVTFAHWRQRLDDRRDVFLGYSSGSRGTAKNLKRFLQDEGATVLDWDTDFALGGTILDEIQQASRQSGAGIFLFTKDDVLQDSVRDDDATPAPRDNVVFEAGYFCAAKGKKRVLIVRERGTKMPADLGGDIYATLTDRADISSIETQASRFLKSL
jgi:hypothetical protein